MVRLEPVAAGWRSCDSPCHGFARARALSPLLAIALVLAAASTAAASEFPAGKQGYHSYTEVAAEVAAVAAAHPDIVSRFSIGKSYQGRELWAVKVSDNVNVDEPEPEVMFDGGHHADEHMGDRDDAPHPPLARRRLRGRPADHDDREHRARSGSCSWSIPTASSTTSPVASSTSGARTASRRPAPARSAPTSTATTATSGAAAAGRARTRRPSPTAGPRAFSTPEDRAMRDFLASRVVGGRQQIRTAITFHEVGRLVMWPYGYTMTDVPGDMTTQDHAALSLIGRTMATTNGYKPEQASDLYISSGTTPRLPIRRLPDLRVHVRDVGRGLSRRFADRGRDRAQQGSRAVPDGARLVPAGGPRRARCAPRAAAPSTTTSRSTAAGPSTRTAPTRRRPTRAVRPRRTRRRRRATAPSSSARRRPGTKAFVTGAPAGTSRDRERSRRADARSVAGDRPAGARRASA